MSDVLPFCKQCQQGVNYLTVVRYAGREVEHHRHMRAISGLNRLIPHQRLGADSQLATGLFIECWLLVCMGGARNQHSILHASTCRTAARPNRPWWCRYCVCPWGGLDCHNNPGVADRPKGATSGPPATGMDADSR